MRKSSECTPRQQSLSMSLPLEVLQLIFSYLSPQDFDSARKSCSLWHLASLCTQSIKLMAGRSGWSSCLTEAKTLSREETRSISALLERETYLAGSSDLKRETESPDMSQRSLFELVSSITLKQLSDGNKHNVGITSFFSVDTNFLLLTQGSTIFVYHLEPDHVSTFLTPVARVVCPERILSVCMDASAGRHSVAALLEGRIACICNLEDELSITNRPLSRWHSPGRLSVVQVDSTHQSVVLYNASFERDLTQRPPRQSLRSTYGSRVDTDEEAYRRLHEIFTDDDRNVSPTPEIQHVPGEPALHDVSIQSAIAPTYLPMSRSHAPLTLYTSIGSTSDPPRSLALCPSRRSCIAFGCGEGVQLHWLEAHRPGNRSTSPQSPASNRSFSPQTVANLRPSPSSESSGSSAIARRDPRTLTYQTRRRHLMKWFPLSAPSDCLRFVPAVGYHATPSYFGVNGDQRQRLRLVSSVDIPNRPGAPTTGGSNWTNNNSRSGIWTRLTRWARGSMAVHSVSTSGSSTLFAGEDADVYDHYRALPLSDGVLLLFVDPRDGMLTLGRDGPSIYGPPARLERLVKFLPPLSKGTNSTSAIRSQDEKGPTIVQYNASWGMHWGLRVVVSFRLASEGQRPEEEISLFTVPPDVTEAFGLYAKSKCQVKTEPWWECWPNDAQVTGRRPCGCIAGSDVQDDDDNPEWQTDSDSSSSPAEESTLPRFPRSTSADSESSKEEYVLRVGGVQVHKLIGSQTTALNVWNVEEDSKYTMPSIVICVMARGANGLEGLVWRYGTTRERGVISVDAKGGVGFVRT